MARHLGVTENLLANWRRRQVGPPFLAYRNGAVRYVRSEFGEWLVDGFSPEGESGLLLADAGTVSFETEILGGH